MMIRRVLAAIGLVLGAGVLPALAQDADMEDALAGSASTPILSLPRQAGRIIGMTEKRTASSRRQVVALEADPSTPGQNQMVIKVAQGGRARRITGADVAAEMADSLPGIPMAIAGSGGHNALGGFGFALGRRGRLACLYAWQSVDDADRFISGSDPGWFSPSHSLSIRVRLCRERLSPRQLVGLMVGLGATGTGDGLGGDALSSAGGMDGFDMPDAELGGVGLALPAMPDEPPVPRRTVPRARPAPKAVAAVPPVPAPAAPVPMPASVATPLPVPAPAPAGLPASVPLAGMPIVPMPD